MQLVDVLSALQRDKARLPTPDEALPGRAVPVLADHPRHLVLGTPLRGPYAEGLRLLHVGMGCFWGAEKAFWQLAGVWTTAVGYGGGFTPNPTYEEVCSGRTGHNELVRIVYDPAIIGLDRLLQVFWEGHDPTQGMRQGNDVGTQYRSGIYLSCATECDFAERSRAAYAAALHDAGIARAITTEIVRFASAAAGDESPQNTGTAENAAFFYFAEGYHQQYLAAHPGGYCGLGGLGVHLPNPDGSHGSA